MRDVAVELKGLHLYGMASAWGELTAQGGLTSLDSSRWLIEHLLQAESTDRAMRSISYQMKAARFPIHRDLAGFDFAQSCVDQRLIGELAELRRNPRAPSPDRRPIAPAPPDRHGQGAGQPIPAGRHQPTLFRRTPCPPD